jgi:hypothetical protein
MCSRKCILLGYSDPKTHPGGSDVVLLIRPPDAILAARMPQLDVTHWNVNLYSPRLTMLDLVCCFQTL